MQALTEAADCRDAFVVAAGELSADDAATFAKMISDFATLEPATQSDRSARKYKKNTRASDPSEHYGTLALRQTAREVLLKAMFSSLGREANEICARRASLEWRALSVSGGGTTGGPSIGTGWIAGGLSA
jgi:hypothetical protein